MTLPKEKKIPARGATEAYRGPRPYPSVGTVLPAGQGPGPTWQRTHIHACTRSERSSAANSQIGVYMLVRFFLSFRGGTKKSHPEQSPHDALMGWPIKMVAPLWKELPYALWSHAQWSYPVVPMTCKVRSCHVGERVAPLRKAPHHVG
jgi:hypothetical protein